MKLDETQAAHKTHFLRTKELESQREFEKLKSGNKLPLILQESSNWRENELPDSDDQSDSAEESD